MQSTCPWRLVLIALTSLSFTFAAALSAPLIVYAGPDYPWSCRDAAAVRSAAIKYSDKSNPYDWDTKKLWRAFDEYAQCYREAADAQDQFEAARGARLVMTDLAFRLAVSARDTNYLADESIAARKRFFQDQRVTALREYRRAKEIAHDAIQIARNNDIDTADFETWNQKWIDDAIAELSAMSFEDIKSYQQLTGHAFVAKSKSNAVHKVAVSKVISKTVASACAKPNVEATAINSVAPVTPAVAQTQGVTGTVNVMIRLDQNSNIVGTPIVQSSPSQLLNAAAIQAAQNSTFHTTIANCQPVDAKIIFAVDFDGQ